MTYLELVVGWIVLAAVVIVVFLFAVRFGGKFGEWLADIYPLIGLAMISALCLVTFSPLFYTFPDSGMKVVRLEKNKVITCRWGAFKLPFGLTASVHQIPTSPIFLEEQYPFENLRTGNDSTLKLGIEIGLVPEQYLPASLNKGRTISEREVILQEVKQAIGPLLNNDLVPSALLQRQNSSRVFQQLLDEQLRGLGLTGRVTKFEAESCNCIRVWLGRRESLSSNLSEGLVGELAKEAYGLLADRYTARLFDNGAAPESIIQSGQRCSRYLELAGRSKEIEAIQALGRDLAGQAHLRLAHAIFQKGREHLDEAKKLGVTPTPEQNEQIRKLLSAR